MTARQRVRLLASLGLALCSAALGIGALLSGLSAGLQLQASDLLFRLRPAQTEPRVVVVGIDERTLAELAEHGRPLTWPRTLHARVIDALKEAGARVIALDLVFDVAAPGDDELARAVREAGNVVASIAGDGVPRLVQPGQPLSYARARRSVPALLEAAADRGHANQFPDGDGTVRRVPLVVSIQGEAMPALSLVAVARFLRRSSALEGSLQDGSLPFAGQRIPVDDLLRMRVDYLGSPSRQPRADAVPLISYLDVLRGALDRSAVRDHIVFIGTTAPASGEDYWVPTARDDRMDGVEIHAHAAATILRGAFVADAAPGVTVAIILALASLVGLAFASPNPLPGLAVALLLALSYLAAAVYVFDRHGLVLDLVHPPLTVGLAVALVMLHRAIFEQRRQRVLRAIFAQYVPPPVAAEIARHPDVIRLGGERRVISILFADLKSFTSFSETVDPEVLGQVITDYLNAMTRIVFEHDGTLDKYIGDAVMAFWNAPQGQPDHARRACLAALAMQRALARLGDEWQLRGLPRQYMRIGINTGAVSVGNMGSALRLAYTAIGDSVNIAARLEPLNNEYGTSICISEYTLADIGDDLRTRYLDLVTVKGRAQPVAVYELVGLERQLTEQQRALLRRYDEGIACYRARRFADALAHFQAALAINEKDGPSAVYFQRCVDLAKALPADDWDGVNVMQRK